MPKKAAETFIGKLLDLYNIHTKEATNLKTDV